MKADRRVLVDPDRAVRCGWCGSYESDKWRNDTFRSSVWCSRSCYSAGHFGEYVGLTISIGIIDLFFIAVESWSQAPPYPNALYLFGFFYLMTIIMALFTIQSHSNKAKIPKR